VAPDLASGDTGGCGHVGVMVRRGRTSWRGCRDASPPAGRVTYSRDMLTVAVLGAVEARRNGDLLSVPTGKTTELLVRLALAGGSPVRVDSLLDDLWLEGAGRNTLQSKVSQLRRALGDKGLVVAGDDTYRLDIRPMDVDAIRILDIARRVSAARRAG